MYTPPFTITPRILSLSNAIQEILGELKNYSLKKPSVKLRKENKIRTIHHSLAIEGNTLTEEQITALLEKKKVLGPKKQIQEVLNALSLYDRISDLDPFSEKDFLKAHKALMTDLINSPGMFRSTGVGIFKGKKIGHVAPQAKMVPKLMKDLFSFVKAKNDIPFLIKACIFHYELEFIHPFEDGNGRMGRLWQQVLLMKESNLFEFLSVETLIHAEQKKYYSILEKCDKAGESTQFIEFSLELILRVLEEFNQSFRPENVTAHDRVKIALDYFENNSFTRKDYLQLHKDISTATASRDLAEAVKEGLLKRKGEKALTKYFPG